MPKSTSTTVKPFNHEETNRKSMYRNLLVLLGLIALETFTVITVVDGSATNVGLSRFMLGVGAAGIFYTAVEYVLCRVRDFRFSDERRAVRQTKELEQSKPIGIRHTSVR